MAEIIKTSRRLTRAYKDNWSHLDKWDDENPITLKVLKGVILEPWQRDQRNGIDIRSDHYDPDPSDAGVSVFTVIVKDPTNLSRSEVLQVLSDTFDTGGCDCPGDCCGCMSSHVSWVETKLVRDKGNRPHRNHWRVVMRHGRNF